MCVNNFNSLFASWGDERLIKHHEVVILLWWRVAICKRCTTRTLVPNDISRAEPDVSAVEKIGVELSHSFLLLLPLNILFISVFVLFLQLLHSADIFSCYFSSFFNLFPRSVHRFSVGVLAGTQLESGPATLHLCNNLLALARDVPPVIIGHWNLTDLRRYGPVPNGFVFEGGTRCGYCEFLFFPAAFLVFTR